MILSEVFTVIGAITAAVIALILLAKTIAAFVGFWYYFTDTYKARAELNVCRQEVIRLENQVKALLIKLEKASDTSGEPYFISQNKALKADIKNVLDFLRSIKDSNSNCRDAKDIRMACQNKLYEFDGLPTYKTSSKVENRLW